MSEELKYKVGDEVLIKGKVVDILDTTFRDTDYPYKIRFDYNNLAVAWSEACTETCIAGTADEFIKAEDNQKTYEQGLNDAWEMARLITKNSKDGGLPTDELLDIYNWGVPGLILSKNTAKEAIDKYNAWKEKLRFKMGDVVEFECGDEIKRAVLYSDVDDAYWVLCADEAIPQKISKSLFKLRKVGHYMMDIDSALKYVEKEIPV